MEQERTGEFEARVKGMQDLSAALQVGESLRTLLQVSAVALLTSAQLATLAG
jgi:hypothetical protein